MLLAGAVEAGARSSRPGAVAVLLVGARGGGAPRGHGGGATRRLGRLAAVSWGGGGAAAGGCRASRGRARGFAKFGNGEAGAGRAHM